jgi:DNA uptake protein ComE-like DNA-binding protein
LGGFRGLTDLKQVRGLPKGVVEGVRGRLTVGRMP